MRDFISALLVIFWLSGCIGTDIVDDPIVDESIEIMPDRIALLVGDTEMATATFSNQFGISEEVALTWSAKPSSIATVDENGLVRAIAPGQAKLFVSYKGFMDSIRVVVVLDATAAAQVDISAPKTSLSVGESVSLTSQVKNIDDVPITTSIVEWYSTDESVLTVDGNGLVTAVGSGMATIFAVSDEVFSNEIEITVGGTTRNGIFMPLGGYKASGTATLSIANGNLILTLSEDFTTSFALGTFIYLSNNNTSGTSIRSGGIELGEITKNGSHMFNVTQKFPSTTLSQYKYVIILCKPANLPFGFAELN